MVWSKIADINIPTCIWCHVVVMPMKCLQDFGVRKLRVPVISCGVVCVMLYLVILKGCDRRTNI